MFFPDKDNSNTDTKKRLPFKLSSVLKVVFTLALVVFIYSQIELATVYRKISSIEISSLFVMVLLYFTSQLVNSFKWRLFLLEAGISVSYLAVFKAFFLGMFVNTFGIGTIGGDLARAMAIPCQKGFRTVCIATVLADRILGLITLLFIGAISLIIVHPEYVPDLLVHALILLVCVLAVFWIVGPKLLLRCVPKGFKYRERLERVLSAFPKRPLVLLYITLVSIVFHSIQITLAVKIFESIKAPISFALAFSSIPFINIASSLPLTINGLGVREAVGIYILQPAGVLNETTVVFAALWLLVVSFVSGVIGACVIPTYGERISEIVKFRKEENQLV